MDFLARQITLAIPFPIQALSRGQQDTAIGVLQLLIHDVENLRIGPYNQNTNTASAGETELLVCVTNRRKDVGIEDLAERHAILMPVRDIVMPAVLEADDKGAVVARIFSFRIG